MSPHAYKVVSTHAHEISGWKIISRPLHSRAPNIGRVNCGVQSDLSNLALNNREQLEDFHSRILILQQVIILSGETLSPTILLLQYMEELSKSNKLKAFIATKKIDLTTFPEKNKK